MSNDVEIVRQLERLNRNFLNLGGFGAGGGSGGGGFGGGGGGSGGGGAGTNGVRASDADRLREVITVQTKLGNASGQLANIFAETIKTTADVEKLKNMSVAESTEQLVALRESMEKAVSIGDLQTQNAIKLEAATNGIPEAFLDMRVPVEEWTEGIEIAQDTIRENTAEVNNSTNSIREFSEGIQRAGSNLRNNAIFAGFMRAGHEVFNVVSTAAEVGGQVTSQQIVQARLMGMSHVELIQTQAKYRQSMGAAGLSTDEFSDYMHKTANATLDFTGSLKAGSVYGAETAKFATMLGVSSSELNSFQEEMNNSTREMVNSMGITASEFMALNDALAKNGAMQKNLMKMDESRRANYMTSMIQERQRLTNMGLFEDQAQDLITNIAELTGATTIDRLESAAKIQSAAGGLGMGREGMEAAEIIRLGANASEPQRARLAEILVELKRRGTEMQGDRNYGIAASGDHLLKTIGPIMDNMDALMAQSGNARKDAEKPVGDGANGPDQMGWVGKFEESIMKFGGIVGQFAGEFGGGALGTTLAGLIIAGFTSPAATGAFALGIGKMILKGLGKATAVGAALGIGVWIGTKINDTFGDALQPAFTWLFDGIAKIGGWFKDIGIAIVDGIKWVDDAASTFFGFMEYMGMAVGTGAAMVGLGIDKIKNFFTDDIPYYFDMAITGIKTTVSEKLDSVKELFGGMFDSARTAVGEFKDKIIEVFKGLPALIKDFIFGKAAGAVDVVADIVSDPVGAAKEGIDAVGGAVGDMAGNVSRGFGMVTDAAGGFFSNMVDSALSFQDDSLANTERGVANVEAAEAAVHAIANKVKKDKAESAAETARTRAMGDALNARMVTIMESMASELSNNSTLQKIHTIAITEYNEKLLEEQKATREATIRNGNVTPARGR